MAIAEIIGAVLLVGIIGLSLYLIGREPKPNKWTSNVRMPGDWPKD
jgi:hypothetical protein